MYRNHLPGPKTTTLAEPWTMSAPTGEQVTITPRNFPLRFRCLPALERHYALIGMATVADGYPLYYEATNEQGLSILAGLNFPGSADYKPLLEGMENVPPFEFIPWILGQCATPERGPGQAGASEPGRHPLQLPGCPWPSCTGFSVTGRAPSLWNVSKRG